MVRETRHLWVGNLPDNIREDRIREHFKRYGRVQSIKLLPRGNKEETGESTMACTVAFMDIKSASKAHNGEHKIDDRTLTTEYYEPAAIPSAASPQNTSSSYSTSPGSTRFPNGHGGATEEHGNFGERYYERLNNRVADGEFIRRPNYHESCRGRNRDRSFRNGPYNAIMDRSHRTPNLPWQPFDGNTRYNSQNETGYATTATATSTPSLENNERRLSDQSTKIKKPKSRSGSRSPPPSGSTSSRSPSRSRSRSSSSSSSSSTSRDTSSSSEKRPVAIRVKNLPPRSSDSSLKDGLFHEYKKHGKVTWVKVVGQGSERYAIVCFKKPEDVEKALEVSHDKLFFGCKIDVEPYQGYDVEDNDLRPYEAEIDEFHPKATRTLFIGNLEKDVTASDLRKHFDQFGEIIEIDIKKQGAVGSYAFCQYSDIVSVVKAIRSMDGEHLGKNRIKLGFGKSMPTNCVWVDGVVDVNEKYLRLQFDQFGSISKVHIDRDKGQALIFFEQIPGAQTAVNKMRGFNVKGSKIQVDFASRECQESFFEHLEKQGAILERPTFEERRDSVTRTFDATANRFARYDTPTRPRASSYSSRSSAAASQVTSAIPSPGTPGSVTPRCTGARSRIARFEYYDGAAAGPDYVPDRHFRNYDEYSQGSGASHEEVYETEYPFNSPSLVDAVVEPRTIPAVIIDHNVVPFVQPDIRNLQKERVHLLEQLEDLPSSGDELISPKKRLKLDILTNVIASDVIIEANRDHRKVMEVRRLSDPNLKHHSRRPSIDNKHNREIVIERTTSAYLPHAVCKRRKTAGSDSGSRTHHYDHSGPESIGGSRPGTPLVDERPEHFTPSEPRRIPREREGPLTLPLPRFAAQVMNRASLSIAGIKGQKDNVLASPPALVTSPRISNPKPPSPVHVPPPASPPPRPCSLSSNSSDSDITPPSPSLDERIRSLDEKYEKWSGSRTIPVGGSDVQAKLDATREKFKLGHKLLDLDLKEVQPSDIVKSVMAKRSVFDEDSKRLENVGDKYEPKEFCPFPRVVPTTPTLVQATPLPAPLKLPPVIVTTQLPKTPTMLSPRSLSAGASVTAAKGLQYPFPSHPPAQLTSPVHHLLTPGTPTTPTGVSTPPSTTSSSSTSSTSSSSATSTTSTINNRGPSHGDTRLKLCASASSDIRTSSKVNVNRSGLVMVSSSSLQSTPTTIKTSEKNISVNIPITERRSSDVNNSGDKMITAVKISSDKITCRRDSSSSSNNSPRAASSGVSSNSDIVKNRRNSDANIRRAVDDDNIEKSDPRMDEKREKERARLDAERLETQRLEREKQEKEKEREKLERENEERLERERIERERRKEREEIERREREEREKQREKQLEQERKERQEKERREEEQRLDRERQEKEQQEKEQRREEKKHKDEEKRKEEREIRYRENHSDNKHRENENKHRENNHNHEPKTKDGEFNNRKEHDSRSSHDKGRHHIERDVERRKESVKENRDNNIHDKQKFNNDNKDRPAVESRHLSIDFDRNKAYESTNKVDPSKRKERNNSLPANIGIKRRLSAHDSSIDGVDEAKKIKTSKPDHKRISERRDSKDSTRSDEKSRSKHKNNTTKSSDEKTRDKYKEFDEKRSKEREERHKSKQQKLEKHKVKSREKDSRVSPSTPKSPGKEITDRDFLARLDLRSNEEIEKQKQLRKEMKEKKRNDSEQKDKMRPEDFIKKSEDRKREKQRNSDSDKTKVREESLTPKSTNSEERKLQKRERIRKLSNSTDNSDSDEPKKHSIFDIVDDTPAYISMYDKVKARSCKNMQKQEQEKRQEKIQATLSQLKQSRAKREEKKRSTSWDEDSDSDREKDINKTKRGSKLCIMSSDEEEMESKDRKKLDIYSDSDLERPRQIKFEQQSVTSEDDVIRSTSKLQRKGSKSRITSDTSDDDMRKIQAQIKSEIFSDNDIDQGFADAEEKHYKNKELNRLIKKELSSTKTESIFGDSSPLPLNIKTERCNSFIENSSGDENNDLKKDRSEMRKKHKKKQKRQKHSLSSEESNKFESVVDGILTETTEKLKHRDKKREHSKKDRKRDKTKEEREKSRKSKKTKSENKSENKREGKMENLFGFLSEDSEPGFKESEPEKPSYNDSFPENNIRNLSYVSDSDREQEKIILETKEKEAREEHRKRKEKKRREKERRLQEEAAASEAAAVASVPESTNLPTEQINENSMDFADMGKQLEANMLSMEETTIKNEINDSHAADDSYNFNNSNNDFHEHKKEERKENREKKKKRKKSKEEKQKHHHHHHHHDKNRIKSETKKDVISTQSSTTSEESKNSEENAVPNHHSLPNLDIPSPKQNKSSSSLDLSISPITREKLISPIPKTPTTSKDKKRDKFIPGFGGNEIDEKIHENAIKSISDFDTTPEIPKPIEESKPLPVPESSEEKPRVVISQEETEDAVAAILGESFGNEQFQECYNEEEEIPTNIADEASPLVEDGVVQDDEEMRQAVQSLSAADIDAKPDTPQSEHELQIDTDTEQEPDDTNIRLDQPPKTPEILERRPKTPETSYYNIPNKDKVIRQTSIGSPPSLTPIKPQLPNNLMPEQQKITETSKIIVSLSLPMLPEPPHPAISQSWRKADLPEPVKALPPTIPTVKHPSTPLRTYGSPPVIKQAEQILYPPLTTITKPDLPPIKNVPEQMKIQTAYPVLHNNQKGLHNLPACSPVPQKTSSSSLDDIKIPATSTNLSLNRLPITPVMVSKPLQTTTAILPQPKIALSLDYSQSITSSESRSKMVFQHSPSPTRQFSNVMTNQSSRMVVQTTMPLSRNLPPSGLLMPSLPNRSYGYLPPTSYSMSSVINQKETCSLPEKEQVSVVTSIHNNFKHSTIIMPPTNRLPNLPTKTFIPVIQEPQKVAPLPELCVTQPSIIQQTKTISEPTTSVIESFPKPSPKQVEVAKEPETKIIEPSKSPLPAKHFAIEQVTAELNLTLEKESVDVDPEKPVKVENTFEKPDTIKLEENEPKPQPLSIEPIPPKKELEEQVYSEKIENKPPIIDVKPPKEEAVIDNKVDSEYWTSKQVNIDSVIKTLGSADELANQSVDRGVDLHKDEWYDEKVIDETKSEASPTKTETSDDLESYDENRDMDDKETIPRGGRRGGRARGRKVRGGLERPTAARRGGKPATIPAKRGGRGGVGRPRGERKSSKSDPESNDIYEFRDDFDDTNKERPRLILTIKSPATVNTQVVLKEVPKEVIVKEQSPVHPMPKPSPPPVVAASPTLLPDPAKEEFLSPVANTRKSRRLQERDVHRNTVDDTIEDVVRNTIMTRSSNQKRVTRQATVKAPPETARKSPRGGRGKNRRSSDPSEDLSDDKSHNNDNKSEAVNEVPKNKELEKEEAKVDMVMKEGFKGAMLRRIKGSLIQEPTALIDPVTGLLTPMRECEEGRYIPVPKQNEQFKSVIAHQQHPHLVKVKPTSLKAHVLSSQTAVAQQQPPIVAPVVPIIQQQQAQPVLQVKKPVHVVSPIHPPTVVSMPSHAPTPPNQNLNVNVSLVNYSPTTHLSPRNSIANMAAITKTSPGSNQMMPLPTHIKQSIASKSLIVAPVQQPSINTHVSHLKQPPQHKQQPGIMNKIKPGLNHHQQQIMHGSVASPPLTKGPMPGMVAGASQNRIMVAPLHQKGMMEPPKIDVSNAILVGARSNLSPQGQPRHVNQAGMPIPSYEASLGETIAHFPPGAVQLRPPHDLSPAHYIHPSHVMQYPFLRQTPNYHLSRSPMIPGGMEKAGDGQEGEEAPVTSPPLELRRPGSVGLALTGRGAVVPHSMNSPHDRTTDSPQVGQVYNMHSARMHHYHSNRYYDQPSTEPPPAHRPLTSHGILTALASERSISHMASLGAPERPLSGHIPPDRPHSALNAHMSTPERPLSTHLPDRTLTNHGLTLGAGLGAAGNLLGAVARHGGADAPASQRGIQAATPPHASQVPPQAESLFMLLKHYPCMWQGLLALKNDQAAVQMYFVSGNESVAKCSLPKNTDGSTPPLRIFQRMRLEPPQVEGVARKMQMENEHCMLLALPCGHDHMDVLKQSTNLTHGFITYLQQKQAAGIVNVAAPGTTQPPAYVVHIFPSCDFVNENLRRIAPSLLERVADIAHLLIVITTV